MIVVNKIGNIISVSYNGLDKSVMYSDAKFAQLTKLADRSETVSDITELEEIYTDVELILSQSEEQTVNELHKDLFKNVKTGKFYLRIKEKPEVISSVALPKALVRRIEESLDKDIDITPLLKCWIRFLRNPKAKNANFAKRFFKYIDMTYVSPKMLREKLEEGYSEELAKEMATVYQVKITKEGLISCYKVSQEVDWKYVAGEDGERKRINLYDKTFDPITGEIVGDSRDDLTAEQRVFIPAVQGTSGDAFYCEGALGSNKLGHEIRVGALHRLPDWSFVNCNDEQSCVPGLHVGGLYYIANYSGEIHNVFVDPMFIGAIPDDDTGAMRVLQYFVHSSFVAINKSIYHSSEYAKKTDSEWVAIKKEILENFGKLNTDLKSDQTEIEALN